MGRPQYTTEETNLFGRSVCKIKRCMTEDLGFPLEFPLESHPQELPSKENATLLSTSPWGHRSFAEAIIDIGKPPIYTSSDNEEDMDLLQVEDYYITPDIDETNKLIMFLIFQLIWMNILLYENLETGSPCQSLKSLHFFQSFGITTPRPLENSFRVWHDCSRLWLHCCPFFLKRGLS